MRLVELNRRKYEMIFGPGNATGPGSKYKIDKVLINPDLVVSVERYEDMDNVSIISTVNDDSFIVDEGFMGIREALQ